MNGREFWELREVSNEQLETSLGELLGAGARVEARIVAHLAEVDARRLHLRAGCSSLFDYCRKRLALSDYEAFVRIAVARVARKYPMVFGMLERRELHLTAICEVRDLLTKENHCELLAEVCGKTKLQIREMLARRFPLADVPTTLKKLPELDPLSPGRYRLLLTLSDEQKRKLELARDLLSHANPSGDLAVVLERALDALIMRLGNRRFGSKQVRAVGSGPLKIAAETSPPSPDWSVSAGSLPDLAATGPSTSDARVANSARAPNSASADAANDAHADAANNANAANSAKAANNSRRDKDSGLVKVAIGHGATNGSRAANAAHGSRAANDSSASNRNAPRAVDSGKELSSSETRKHITREVRRALVARDGMRCGFVSEDGVRCDARAFLQFHHRQPWACGGSDTADNLMVLCRAHNRLLAEQDFGSAHIERWIAARSRRLLAKG
jgi:hypothetical protein